MIDLQMKEARGLLTLLAHELFDRDLCADFEGMDWRILLATAHEHAVCPLLYSGMGKLGYADSAAFDFVERLAVRSTVYSDRMAKTQKEIIDLMNENGIRCAVLKGTSVAAFYRHPEVRMTGDIDILIDGENMDACARALQSAGYDFEGRSDIHANFRKGRAAVEIHERVTRYPGTPKGEYAENFMKDALNHLKPHAIGENVFPMLTDEWQLVSLISHTERHMGAGGIGLRQLCDWAVAVSNVDAGRTDAIVTALKNCGLYVFACVLTGVSEKYLGMPKCKWLESAREEMIDETMEEILSVGNFQAQYRNRPKASAIIDPYDIDGDGKRKIIKTYLRRVKKKMASDFPKAKRKIWVPFFGAYYFAKWLISVIKGEIDIKGTMNTIKTSKKREQFLRKMCLYK